MRKSILFLLFISCTFLANSANKVNARLDKTEIKVGEQASLDISIQYTAGASQLIFPSLQDTISKFIEIVDISKIDTTFDEDDITQKILHQKITITSWDSGYHVIPPFRFVLNSDTLESKALMLSVRSIPVKAEADIKDIKSVLDVPFSLSDWILAHKKALLVLLGSILLLLALIFLYRKFLRNKEMPREEVVPKEAADLLARRKLQELESKRLWQNGEVKSYYSELSFIFREYLENRFLLPALEQSSIEIINSIKQAQEIDKEDYSKIKNFLELADMAKFAKQTPLASENEEVLKYCFQFIEKTKFIPTEAEVSETAQLNTEVHD